jgi:hypothetical protein
MFNANGLLIVEALYDSVRIITPTGTTVLLSTDLAADLARELLAAAEDAKAVRNQVEIEG